MSHIFFLMTEDEETEYLSHVLTPIWNHIQSMLKFLLMPWQGAWGANIIKVQGFTGKHKLNILVDIGASQSFISEPLAYQLNCPIETSKPIVIQIHCGRIILFLSFVST